MLNINSFGCESIFFADEERGLKHGVGGSLIMNQFESAFRNQVSIWMQFRSIWNESSNSTKYREDLEELLGEYELVVEMAVDNGIDIVTQEYNINWDYIQVSF